MKSIFPIFWIALCAVTFAIGWRLAGTPLRGQTSRAADISGPRQGPGNVMRGDGDNASTNTVPPETTGNALLTEAIYELSRRRSIMCRIRHRVNMYGQELVGSGNYRQLNLGRDVLVRLELKIPISGRVTTLQHVCDGRFLWIRRSFPAASGDSDTHSISLSRVDLNVVRRAISENRDPGIDVTYDGLLGQGGLTEMMINLERSFEFSKPRSNMLYRLPVWVTTGTWRPEVLAQWSDSRAGQGDAAVNGQATALPAHLPHTVVIALAQDDLFPYRIEYHRRKSDAPGKKTGLVGSAGSQAALIMELFEVQMDGPIDARIFDYRPENVPVEDLTEQYLARQR